MASSQLVFPWALFPWMTFRPGPQKILPLRFLKLFTSRASRIIREILAYDLRPGCHHRSLLMRKDVFILKSNERQNVVVELQIERYCFCRLRRLRWRTQ